MAIDRRALLGGLAGTGAAGSPGRPRFTTADKAWQGVYDKALQALEANVRVLPYFPDPVLIEGSSYNGIWMECGPHEALVHRRFRPDVARNSHMAFFALQKDDGQLPANIKGTGLQFGQIQMVTPIAATAWELAEAAGDEALLRAAYRACSRWDDWLVRYRMTRGTGLVEAFCTYDTGQDNSPRFDGVPVRCPDADARRLPAAPGLPRLAPDLSATTHGARIALAAMAGALGRPDEADRWRAGAEQIRRKILETLYLAADAGFYDLDADGRYVRVAGDVLSRVCAEHVVDQTLFETLWSRRLHDHKSFWAADPFPSIAMNDPRFVRPIPPNSWGGAAQALTALRSARWMDHYGRAAEHAHLMQRWCEAIVRAGDFRQQLDPATGVFTQGDAAPNYSPCALMLVDSTWRLAGVREEAGRLAWTVRPGAAPARAAEFVLPLGATGEARLRYQRAGADLLIGRRRIGSVEGGTARLFTDLHGRPLALEGVAETPQTVTIHLSSGHSRAVRLAPNQRLRL